MGDNMDIAWVDYAERQEEPPGELMMNAEDAAAFGRKELLEVLDIEIAKRLLEVTSQRDALLAVSEELCAAMVAAGDSQHCYLEPQYRNWRHNTSFGELEAYDELQAIITTVKGG